MLMKMENKFRNQYSRNFYVSLSAFEKVDVSDLCDLIAVRKFLNSVVDTWRYLYSMRWYFFFEWPRSRCYGRTAALRLIVQPCDGDDLFFYVFLVI
jgi:hypothetical protein